jgi:hypothetical protein
VGTSTGTGTRRWQPPEPVAMAVTSAAALGAACAALLATGTRSAAAFLDPGALGPSAAIIRRDFGPGAVPAGRTGYDGQQFYAIARFFPHLTRAARYLDAPRYRLLRIGAPALASVAGRGPALVVALVALNVVGVGLAVGALADIARRHGRPAWIGYLAVPALLEGLTVSTPEPLAAGLALTALCAADRGRHGRAVLLLVAAALVRESGAVVALAAAAGLILSRVRPRWTVLVGYLVPAAVLLAWSEVLGSIVGGSTLVAQRFAPLGLLRASTPSIALGVGALLLAALGAWWWRDVAVAWPVAAVFGAWILVYTAETSDWLALPRAAAPALVLGLAATAGATSGLLRPAGPAALLRPRTG